MATNSSKYVVCPECEGEGSLPPGFVWTEEEVMQEDPEEFEQMQADLRAGVYNVPCRTCKGKRVVVDVETDGEVTTTAAERWEDELLYRAEVAAEERYFGYMR